MPKPASKAHDDAVNGRGYPRQNQQTEEYARATVQQVSRFLHDALAKQFQCPLCSATQVNTDVGQGEAINATLPGGKTQGPSHFHATWVPATSPNIDQEFGWRTLHLRPCCWCRQKPSARSSAVPSTEYCRKVSELFRSSLQPKAHLSHQISLARSAAIHVAVPQNTRPSLQIESTVKRRGISSES